MFITVVAHVHNDRCEITFSWVSENCLWVFRKLFVGFQKTKGYFWAYGSLAFMVLNACVSVGYTTLTDD